MGLSARIFGLSSWSMLVPQALEGVAAVGLLYATVRPRFRALDAASPPARSLALTPVAALMFRFDNPDALLVLLLVAAAYAVIRALEGGSTRWILLAGSLVGFAFLTKMLQAFLVLPAFALVYLVARRPRSGGGSGSSCSAASRSSSRPAGGWRSSSSGRPRRGRTSAARPTTACSTWCSATTASTGISSRAAARGGGGGGGIGLRRARRA